MIELARLSLSLDNPSMDDNLPKPRRWFRFSLRTMFVLLTGFAIGIGIVRALPKREERPIDELLFACATIAVVLVVHARHRSTNG